ncbi:3-oxoacyl-[acyl-carrier-protein] synthase 1 [Planctopirus ephydatiae]|jgi:3-oxoacyl-[acyl-carrier-protein] synthase-1|uniref:3-oxoacyl-[acyl-carrier-protein] synthase 1 n=1 Tax=Planctopirus ephydatiae TaxID=2528019 RepID=A0A518GTF1_9PLAN|nr:beta-ketoacyl-[acyl-carrier-protein] synthase family protein [Planctopirus ephydatiae]QDV31864.1 3-oxoacyl-[acyl-carrier-protein] synthase 1 [Planctopirus ephydatiae]
MFRRIAITGMGIVNSLGNSVPEVLGSLRAGKSGVSIVDEYRELGFRSALAGTLKDFQPPEIDRIYLRQMGDNGVLTTAATFEAIRDANLSDELIQHSRTGVIVGNSGTYKETYQLCHQRRDLGKKITGLALPRAMASTVSANLSVLLKTKGHCFTVNGACAGAAVAIVQAAWAIRLGLQDRMITGGVHWGSWEFDCLFDALRVFSRREDNPTAASRPFDADRDGLVPSTAAGMVVLEDWEHAIDRGAKIHGELIGIAVNSDGQEMTTPSGEGSGRCIRLALDDAGIGPGDIQYINAHATGTKLGDEIEARTIGEIFGQTPYVSSTKSGTGHEVSAGGATELIYTLLMMKHGFIAPTLNLERIDDQCAMIRHVPCHPIEADIQLAMSNSFGFGGVNAVLLVRRVET